MTTNSTVLQKHETKENQVFCKIKYEHEICVDTHNGVRYVIQCKCHTDQKQVFYQYSDVTYSELCWEYVRDEKIKVNLFAGPFAGIQPKL